jgi:hypothetical protein
MKSIGTDLDVKCIEHKKFSWGDVKVTDSRTVFNISWSGNEIDQCDI